jgi:sugar phosphate isomerase/epimerase
MLSAELKRGGLSLSVRFPWKIGIVSIMAFPSMTKGQDELTASLKAIGGDPFFDAVEVPLIPDPQWDLVKGMLEGKDVARGCQPDLLTKKLDLNSAEGAKRRGAIEYVKLQVEEASKRGLRRLAVCSGPDPGKGGREVARRLLVDSLKEICSHASQLGVEVLLETFDRDWDKKLLIGPLDEAVQVVEAVGGPAKNIGLMWDLSHAPLLGEGPDDLRGAKHVLKHVHFGCTKQQGEKLLDWHPVFHTKGAINTVHDVAVLFRTLLDIGYEGAVAFEVKPEEQQTSQEVLSMSKGVLLSAFQEVALERMGS